MSLYTGTAKLTYDGKTRDVLLSLDLNEYCLVAKHPQDEDPFQCRQLRVVLAFHLLRGRWCHLYGSWEAAESQRSVKRTSLDR